LATLSVRAGWLQGCRRRSQDASRGRDQRGPGALGDHPEPICAAPPRSPLHRCAPAPCNSWRCTVCSSKPTWATTPRVR